MNVFSSLVLLVFLVTGLPNTTFCKPNDGIDAANVTKPVSFAVLEDYDKGDDLNDIALDFELLNELGIDEMRCSFGWDDYEPHKGEYDFAWLKQFVELPGSY